MVPNPPDQFDSLSLAEQERLREIVATSADPAWDPDANGRLRADIQRSGYSPEFAEWLIRHERLPQPERPDTVISLLRKIERNTTIIRGWVTFFGVLFVVGLLLQWLLLGRFVR